ncbi:MAG: PEGA domain-containing protein [Myxococcota bacterium]
MAFRFALALCLSFGALARADAPAEMLIPPEPPRVAAPVQAALLIACNVEGASVFVDGEPAGTVPMAALSVLPGEHQILVRAEGFGAQTRSVDVPPEGTRANVFLEPSTPVTLGESAAIPAGPEGRAPPKPWYRNWIVWTIVGVAAVAVIGTAVAVSASGGSDGGTVIPVPPIPGGSM